MCETTNKIASKESISYSFVVEKGADPAMVLAAQIVQSYHLKRTPSMIYHARQQLHASIECSPLCLTKKKFSFGDATAPLSPMETECLSPMNEIPALPSPMVTSENSSSPMGEVPALPSPLLGGSQRSCVE